MKTWMKCLICISLSVLCLFTCVGYAAVTGNVTVKGNVEVKTPEGLFIVGIKTMGSNNLDKNTVSYIDYSTTVNSIISRKNTGNQYSTTYDITVLNNTPYEYAYRKLYYIESYGSNSYVSEANANDKLGVVVSFPNGNIVPKNGGKLTFRVTYTIGKSVNQNLNLDTMLNFQFGINVNSIDDAYDIVHNKFLDILNTKTTYDQLIEVLDDKFDGYQTWTSNYIGNVGDAVNNDMMAVETLFAGQLTMIVNGQTQKAWVIIKHENIDGNTLTGDDYTVRYNDYGDITHEGCEMTLYMTVDPLDTPNGLAPVYVTVFTCDRNVNGNIGKWYQVGSSYYGQANIVGYLGEYGGTGSFVTDNWLSYASTYQVTDDYSYSVAEGNSISTLMTEIDATAIAEFQSLLDRAEIMIANQKYAGTGISVVEDAYEKAAAFYTVDANGKAIANANTRRVFLIPIMQELDHVLTVAQEAIDKVEQEQQPQ